MQGPGMLGKIAACGNCHNRKRKDMTMVSRTRKRFSEFESREMQILEKFCGGLYSNTERIERFLSKATGMPSYWSRKESAVSLNLASFRYCLKGTLQKQGRKFLNVYVSI